MNLSTILVNFAAAMAEFTTTILKYDKNGEKSGWTYIELPPDVVSRLHKTNKKSFRVQGLLDNYEIKRVAVVPVGGGKYILAFNAAMRRGTGKRQGDIIKARLYTDNSPIMWDTDFINCLVEDKEAHAFFKTLSNAQKHYFLKWINEARTQETKAERIANSLKGLARHLNYGQTLRALKDERLNSRRFADFNQKNNL